VDFAKRGQSIVNFSSQILKRVGLARVIWDIVGITRQKKMVVLAMWVARFRC